MRYVIVCFIFVFIACHYNPGKDEGMENVALSRYLSEIPDYAYAFNYKDTLLFSFSKATTNIDTSWTLFLTKKDCLINCHYNHILPYSVTGFNDYLDESKRLLFYEGFSFNIDEQDWKEVVNLSRLNTYLPKDTTLYRGCPHCPEYMAYYNSKIILSGQDDKEFLGKLDSLLKTNLLNAVFEKRKNPPIQLQKNR